MFRHIAEKSLACRLWNYGRIVFECLVSHSLLRDYFIGNNAKGRI